jgi:hypothetical protein
LHIEDENFQLQYKYESNRSYRKNQRNFLLKRVHAGIFCSICFVNFKTSKWVQLGTLLKTPERKPKENSLATARVQKENPKENKPGCLPQSAFFIAI